MRSGAVGPWPLLLVLAGCLEIGGETPRSECDTTSDCNTAAGEVCEEGVCWGDPPVGTFAAVLGPPTSAQESAAATEIPQLAFAADGWFGDVRTGELTLAPSVKVTGKLKAPCPPQLTSCSGYLFFGGQVRWSRASGITGGDKVAVPAVATAAGFEVFLPRPEAPTTYLVTIVPSPEPLGAGQPSAAQFFPPQRFTVVLDPDEPAGARDFLLGSASVRTISGRITRSNGQVAGWRVLAEASDPEAPGTFALVSNVVPTTANGDFSLLVSDDRAIVDLVIAPPLAPNRAEQLPPSLRVRDHVVGTALAPIDVPVLDSLASMPVTVRGSDGSGEAVAVAAATVRARLDQELSPGIFLRYETTATTSGGSGTTSLPVYLGSDSLPLHYFLDVLPGPGVEQASTYDVEVVVRATLPAPTITLTRRVAVVGQLRDEHGLALTDTPISASVSGASLCAMTSRQLRNARALAPAQAITDSNGEFKLWVDPELAGMPLNYDLAIEPSVGTWAPRWTFINQAVTTEELALWTPPAAHVRARVFAPGREPLPDTVVSIYELTGLAPPCNEAFGTNYAGGLELRAIGVSEPDGIVRMILPRTASIPTD